MLLLGVVQAQVTGAPAGAGSYDLLATEIVTSPSDVVFTSISSAYGSTYEHLQIRATVRRNLESSGLATLEMTINAPGSSNHSVHRLQGDGSTVFSSNTLDQNTFLLLDHLPQETAPIYSPFICDILDFANTNKTKTIRAMGGGNATTESDIALSSGLYNSLDAVESITLKPGSLGFAAGSRISLYGLKASV